MQKLDIAIIVPIYNASKYLRECLDSICAQTYKDWKCVLVNDGSTDNSQEIIDEYCAKDSRFSCLKKQNEKSASKARRYGLLHTDADWIMYVDADDAIDADLLEKLVVRQVETEADCVTGYRIGCADGVKGEIWRIPHKNFDMSQVLTGRECCLMTIGGWNMGGTGITRRSILIATAPGPYMNSDEFEVREQYLLIDKRAFVESNYYFRHNIGTSDRISVRMFDRTLVDMQLEQFVYDNFPERKDKILALAWQRLFNLIYLTADFNIHIKEFTPEEQEKAQSILLTSYNAINRKTSRKAAPLQSLMLTHSFKLFNVLATIYVKYKRSHGGKFFYR